MYSYWNTFYKWSICIRIHIRHFTMYSYLITFVCIRPHVCTDTAHTAAADTRRSINVVLKLGQRRRR